MREFEEIDKQLKEFQVEYKVRTKFVKISDGIFTFAGKKIFVKLLNHKLAVKVGDGY